MEVPLMVKAVSRNNYYAYLPMHDLIITTASKALNACIDGICSSRGEFFETLISIAGEKVKIKSLNCKSYEEFLVALDMHNLIFGQIDNSGCDGLTLSALTAKCRHLQEENDQLKLKLDAIEKALKIKA